MRKIVLLIATASIFALATPAFATETENTDTAAASTNEAAANNAEPSTDELPALPDKVASTSITFGLDIKTDYMLDDAIRPTKGVVLQPWVAVPVTGNLTFNVWNSVGIKESTGNETDVGFTYIRGIVHFTVNEYILYGDVPDITELTLGVTKNGFSASASYYAWYGGLQDGVRLEGSYDLGITPKLTASVSGVYETGFEAPDTFIASLGLAYAISSHVSLNVKGYLPSKEDGIHERRVVAGIAFGF